MIALRDGQVVQDRVSCPVDPPSPDLLALHPQTSAAIFANARRHSPRRSGLRRHAHGESVRAVSVPSDHRPDRGTAAAATRLVEKLQGKVVGLGFVIELGFLKGREKLNGYE